MEKKSYESPEFGFQEMKLMERVAEKCWGHGYAWVDHDAVPNTPPENYYFSPSGCAGYDDQNRLNSLIQKYPMVLSILVYTFFSRMFDLMLPPVAKHSIVVA